MAQFQCFAFVLSKTRPYCLVWSQRHLDSQSASMLLRNWSVQRTYGGSGHGSVMDLISIKGDFPNYYIIKRKNIVWNSMAQNALK